MNMSKAPAALHVLMINPEYISAPVFLSCISLGPLASVYKTGCPDFKHLRMCRKISCKHEERKAQAGINRSLCDAL